MEATDDAWAHDVDRDLQVIIATVLREYWVNAQKDDYSPYTLAWDALMEALDEDLRRQVTRNTTWSPAIDKSKLWF
jgi:hypothetical protein